MSVPVMPARRDSARALERYAFGEFVLDPLQRMVHRRDGAPLALTPRLFNALQLFVEQPGKLLEKDWLLAALWPRVVVEENSLSQVVSALRRALNDEGQRYIRTEPRRGFRFVAEVSVQAALVESNPTAPLPAALSGSTALAVLPFVSLADDSHDDLLEVGMADSLIARLSSLPGFAVRSVGSVRRFAGIERDPLAAARMLHVGWVVDGSIQRRADRMRVTARLLSVADGVAAWSDSFDEKIDGVFEVQDAIAGRVAESLALRLSGAAAAPQNLPKPAGGGTRDVEAYHHYLTGLANIQGISAEGLSRCAADFDRALRLDPDYALALVGKADACRRMVWGADRAPVEAFTAARPWILQALALAPDLAEAHCELASVLYWYDYNWAEAAREFRQALALKPSHANAHFGLGYLLGSMGRIDLGLQHTRQACDLDPMGLVFNTHYACFLAHVGERADAHARLRWVLEVAPAFWVGHLALGRLRLTDGDLDAAIAAARRADELCAGRSTQAASMLGAFCARAGLQDEARSILQGLQRRAAERYVPPTSLAAVHAALGERDAALAQLEHGFDVHDTRLIYVKNDWRWESLKDEPRYHALLQRLRVDGCGPGLNGT